MRSRIELALGRLGSLALVAGLLLTGTSAFAQQLRDGLIRAVLAEQGQPTDAGQPESYWIGISCGELTDALRAQLELPEGQGVLVDEVLPDSPAAQAGLKKHDVIVSAGEKTLTNPMDLIDAVAQAKETELNLQIFRAGKKLTQAVKPAKRPQAPGEPPAAGAPAEVDAGKLQELIQQFLRQHGDGNMRWRMLQPGMVLPPGAPFGAPHEATLPDNVTISITKQGKQPAKISVKQGDQSWELTSDELQKLPPELRVHVERMLGRAPMAGYGVFGAHVAPPGPTGPGGGGGVIRGPVRVEINEGEEANRGRQVPPRVRSYRSPGEAGVEQRLDELNKQIHELREAIEKLQKQTEGK